MVEYLLVSRNTRIWVGVTGFLSIRISDYVKARLEEQAKARGLNTSEYVREILTAIAEGRNPKIPGPDREIEELRRRVKFLEDTLAAFMNLLAQYQASQGLPQQPLQLSLQPLQYSSGRQPRRRHPLR